jgi:putative phosphoribosyl transferase
MTQESGTHRPRDQEPGGHQEPWEQQPRSHGPGPRALGAGRPLAPPARELQPPLWPSRREAGLALAERLGAWRDQPGALVVGLPRGGVAVAAELAGALRLPLASWAVRKLGHPADPEVAIGAIAPAVCCSGIGPACTNWGSPPQQAQLVADQQRELERRRQLFGDPEPASLRDRALLVVDDGRWPPG